jgi:three-Cys-motif partner protein
MAKQSDPNPAHWDQYGPFQHVKHNLIRCYLGGWYPKLSWSGRVLYVDTHAGRGVFETGDPGSPLVALRTLLEHSHRDNLLAASEYNFLFIERDPENLAMLNGEIDRLKPLPPRVNVDTSEGDAFGKLSSVLADLRRDGQRMSPAFLFVDPYGFKIPGRVLADLMNAGDRVELFINIMWRELDMLVQQRPPLNTPHANTLDEIFASGEWRHEITGATPEDRLDQAVRLLARAIGARWWTSAVRMSTGGATTRYALLHLTNSDKGRDLMKSCSWSIFPAGQFLVRKSDNPDQQVLFEPEPDLTPVRAWVIEKLKVKARHWQDLHEAIRSEIWLEKHLNEVVRALKAEGVIDADRVPGRRFAAASNPLLRLAR